MEQAAILDLSGKVALHCRIATLNGGAAVLAVQCYRRCGITGSTALAVQRSKLLVRALGATRLVKIASKSKILENRLIYGDFLKIKFKNLKTSNLNLMSIDFVHFPILRIIKDYS